MRSAGVSGVRSQTAEFNHNAALITEAILVIRIRKGVGISCEDPIQLGKPERDALVHADIDSSAKRHGKGMLCPIPANRTTLDGDVVAISVVFVWPKSTCPNGLTFLIGTLTTGPKRYWNALAFDL